MKVIGCICITLSCMGLGILFVTKQAYRRSCISSAILALEYLKTEIMSTNMPLPEIFEKLAISAESSIRPLFFDLCKGYKSNGSSPMSQIWENAIMGCNNVSFSDYQRSELLGLGNFLGRYSACEQCTAIDICVLRLEAQLQMMNKKVHNSRSLYPGLGLSVGLMLSIIFV